MDKNRSINSDRNVASQKKLRVAMVQPALAKYRAPVFRKLAQRSGIELTVYFGTRGNLLNVEADGFEAVEAPLWSPTIAGQKLLFQSAQWWAASRKITDVLIVTWTPRYLALPAVLLKAKFLGIPTILWGHGFSKNDKFWWKAIREFYGRLGSALLFYDSDTAKDCISKGTNPAKVFVAQNTIDHVEIDKARKTWANDDNRLREFRIENSIEEGPVLLYVSRLEPANRLDLLVRATAELAGRFPSLTTVIIGNGDKQRDELIELAKELRVDDRIRFLPGIYNEVEIAPWFLSADLFCYPQNIGLSLIHSFWYGLPVLTSDKRSCQNPEIAALQPGINGLTYQHGDVSSMVKAIESVLNDSSRKDSLSKAAYDTVEKSFQIDHMVDGIESAIRYAHETTDRSSR